MLKPINQRTVLTILVMISMVLPALPQSKAATFRNKPFSVDASNDSGSKSSISEIPAEVNNLPPPQPSSLQQSKKPLSVQAVAMSVSNRDSFPNHGNGGRAVEGDVINYSVAITNSGDTDATNVVFNDIVDVNTSTLVAGSPAVLFIVSGDTYSTVGNVRLNTSTIAGPGQHVIDNDVLNGATLTGFGATQATANGTLPNGTNTVTTSNGGTVTMNADGSFTYAPAAGFGGTGAADSFWYTLTTNTGSGFPSGFPSGSARVTINVGSPIWFVNSAAAPGGNGSLTNPFNCYTGTTGPGQTCFSDTAADDPGDSIFLFNGNYTGGYALLGNQKLIGQGATATLASIAGVTLGPGTDALPTTNGNPANVTITTTIPATNAIPVSAGGITLRGFTVGNTIGAKIFGTAFGTLTAGNNTTPDVVLNGTGQALSLTNGTFAATSGFNSVTTTSSPGTGVTLSQVAGTVGFGSTTVSGSTAQGILVSQSTLDVNFGNTAVGTATANSGGTNSVSLQSNTSGTRTFGTLTIQNNTGAGQSAYLSTAGGNSVAGTTNVSGVVATGFGIDIRALAAGRSASFGATTVTKTTAGAAVNLGVSASGNAGNITFLSLNATNSAGDALIAADNTGTITVTNNTGSLSATNGVALSITKAAAPLTPVDMDFANVNSSGGTNGINLVNLSGAITTTGGALTATGTVFNVSGGTVSVTYSGGITQANNAAMVFIGGGHATGTITFQTGTLSATNGTGLQFDNADGIYNFNGTTTLNGSGDEGIDILNGSGGTFTFSANTSITSPSGIAFNVVGGTASVTYSGNITQATAGQAAVSVSGGHATGTITFQTGTISATNGTGLQFDNADGTYNFNGTSTLNGGDAGIDILNGSAGTFSFSSATITNPSGTAFNVGTSPGNPSVTYSGSITQNTSGQRVVSIDGTTGNTITFQTGTITGGASSTGININNANGNVTFSNGMTLGTSVSRMTNQAVTITNGTGTYSMGAVSIFTNNVSSIVSTNADGTLNSTSGTVDSSNATAVNIDGPAGLTTLGMTLTRVDSSGGTANGITIQDTNGSFIVNGDGSNTSVGGNGSGGTIANKSGADGTTTAGNGVFLTNASGVTLRRMTINGTNQNHGIRGVSVSNFTMEFVTVSGTNGTNTGLDEGSVNFDNLTGTAAITSCLIEGGLEDNLNVVNTSGTLNRLTISGSTFGFNNTTNGNNNILIESQNAGTTLNFTLKSSLIKGARADWINFANNSGSTGDSVIGGPLVADGNTFDNLGANHNAGSAPGGNRVVFGGVGNSTVDIRNNTTKGSLGEAIRVRATIVGATRGIVNARIRNNTVGVQGTANSGSSEGSGIFAFADGGGNLTVAITNNTVYQYNNHGIRVDFGDEIIDGSVENATVTGNTVSNPGNINTDFNGIHLNNGTVAATDNFTSCVDIGGAGALANIVTGSGSGVTPPNNGNIRTRQRQSTTVRLPGYAGPARDNSDNDVAEVATYLAGRNTGTTFFGNSVSTGGGFINTTPAGTPCTQPSFALATPIENNQRNYFAWNDSQKNSDQFSDPTTSTDSGSTFVIFNGLRTSGPAPLPTVRFEQSQKPAASAIPTAAKATKIKQLEGSTQTAEVRHSGSLLQTRHAALEVLVQKPEVRRQTSTLDVMTRRTGVKNRESVVRTHHAKFSRAVTPLSGETVTANVSTLSTRSQAKTADKKPQRPESGGTVNLAVGTISAGSTAVVNFQVTVNNAAPAGTTQISNQGSVSGSNFATVVTDDPDTAAPNDPTITPIVTPSAANGVITGRILNDSGQPVEGTVITLNGGQTRKTITDADGNYKFENVETGEFYTVTPSRSNHVFTPSQRSFNQLAERTEASFAGAFTGDSANPLDSTEYFVRQQYVDILGREPDEGGFNYWSDRILECGSDLRCVNTRRQEVAAAFFIEQEFQQGGSFIYDVYKGSLGRRPLFAEYSVDRRQVVAGPDFEAMKTTFTEGFVQRAEFMQKYPTGLSAAEFVDALIQNVQLTSSVDLSAERENLLARYQAGTSLVASRALVLRGVAEHDLLRRAEYNSAFVLTEYFGYLRRDPEPAGFTFWLGVLNSQEAGNFRGMVCAFINSAEYQRRFSNIVSRSDRDCGP